MEAEAVLATALYGADDDAKYAAALRLVALSEHDDTKVGSIASLLELARRGAGLRLAPPRGAAARDPGGAAAGGAARVAAVRRGAAGGAQPVDAAHSGAGGISGISGISPYARYQLDDDEPPPGVSPAEWNNPQVKMTNISAFCLFSHDRRAELKTARAISHVPNCYSPALPSHMPNCWIDLATRALLTATFL